jgi:hypothetical protein
MPRQLKLRLALQPHSTKQDLIFNSLFIPGLLEMWVACGTKFGKTLSACGAMTLALPVSQQALYRVVAPIYNQSKISFKYIRRMLPPPPHVKPNETALTLSMPHNDSLIQFCTGQDAEALEGEATAGNILDECAKMKEAVYASVKTTTSVTRGPIIGISTPRGKASWFYRKCMEAKEEMVRAKYEGRRPTKIFIHAPSRANPFVSQEVIDDARKTLPHRLFQQYYEAEFVSEGGVFVNYDRCFKTDYLDYADQFVWLKPGHKESSTVIGADWARTTDFTVFTAVDIKTREVVGVQRMRGVPYPVQVQRLKAFTENFKTIESVWHDKTGVGMALDDILHSTDLPFHGITFSNASKNELMVKLMLGFETEMLGIPNIGLLSTELNDLEVNTTATGLPTYSAPDGAHDDMVMSLALANAAMLQHVERDYSIVEF